MSKRRKGFPSETQVKRGVRIVHGDKELMEKVGRNDPCPCGSGKRFKKCCRNSGCFRRCESGLLLSGNDSHGNARLVSAGRSESRRVSADGTRLGRNDVQDGHFVRNTLIHSTSILNAPAFLSPSMKPRALISFGSTAPASLKALPNDVASNLSSGSLISIHSSFFV
jgi:hypothetical protein